MGRTYEALERAEKEYQQQSQQNTPLLSENLNELWPFKKEENHSILHAYVDLKANILTRYDAQAMKTILFTGTSSGVGSSTTANNFAALLAKDSEYKVLIIDIHIGSPHRNHSNHSDRVDQFPRLRVPITPKKHNNFEIKQLGKGNLYVLSRGGNYINPDSYFELGQFFHFISTVRQNFDYIILDAPAVSHFPEALVLFTKVDGVVLVIESGKTRRQVAISAKKRIAEAGGKMIGVVINKRKYYIPNIIYKRL